MQKTEEVVLHEFAGVRTGKASPALVENVLVEVYGSQMRIRELAGITTPEARLLVVQPWDAASVSPIDKALQKANLGATPQIDGKIIRLAMPELSEERRQEYVKLAKKMAEDGRVAVRHVRRDAIQHLKTEHKNGDITEDDLKRVLDQVQSETNGGCARVDDLVKLKEVEILEV